MKPSILDRIKPRLFPLAPRSCVLWPLGSQSFRIYLSTGLRINQLSHLENFVLFLFPQFFSRSLLSSLSVQKSSFPQSLIPIIYSSFCRIRVHTSDAAPFSYHAVKYLTVSNILSIRGSKMADSKLSFLPRKHQKQK